MDAPTTEIRTRDGGYKGAGRAILVIFAGAAVVVLLLFSTTFLLGAPLRPPPPGCDVVSMCPPIEQVPVWVRVLVLLGWFGMSNVSAFLAAVLAPRSTWPRYAIVGLLLVLVTLQAVAVQYAIWGVIASAMVVVGGWLGQVERRHGGT